MVDKVNPNTQFHPYQPEKSIPQTGNATRSRFGGILSKVGLDSSKIDALGSKVRGVDVRGQMNKARTVARNNPSMILGGLAALAIGAGLMRRRAMR